MHQRQVVGKPDTKQQTLLELDELAGAGKPLSATLTGSDHDVTARTTKGMVHVISVLYDLSGAVHTACSLVMTCSRFCRTSLANMFAAARVAVLYVMFALSRKTF